jgi:spectinomycin phosphotransferase
MRDDPGLSFERIAVTLELNYGIVPRSIAYLPIGHDMRAFVYRVETVDAGYFLKIRAGAVYEASLQVPRALIDAGIEQVIAPLRTISGSLWCDLDGGNGHTVVLYPFISGQSGMTSGVSPDQWRAFGIALRAVHDSGLHARFESTLRVEDFVLPSAAKLRRMLAIAGDQVVDSPEARRFHDFWRENQRQIDVVLRRSAELGDALRAKPFELVLCHSDIHAANLLIGDDGRLWLIDWDGPLIAPRERDLLFVIGSRIALRVKPDDEARFFEGYGTVEIDPDALRYYRYERIVEDLGEFAESIMLTPDHSEEWRAYEAGLARSLFEPDGDIERAERVPRTRWSGEKGG